MRGEKHGKPNLLGSMERVQMKKKCGNVIDFLEGCPRQGKRVTLRRGRHAKKELYG